MFRYNRTKGFSLIEILLVLVIISAMIVGFINYSTSKMDAHRRDLTVIQVQQLLNAGLSYYVTNGTWPTTVTDLQTGHFIPSQTLLNPLGGNPYVIGLEDPLSPGSGNLAVCTVINVGTAQTASVATILAGQLPLSYLAEIDDPSTLDKDCSPIMAASKDNCASATNCVLVSQVNIPGQNLNNARSVNLASVYYSGSCVPAPTCPGTMVPQIFVVPISVNGVNDEPVCNNAIVAPYDPNIEGCSATTYSVNSFSAFARGDLNGNAVALDSGGNGPLDCNSAVTIINGVPFPAGKADSCLLDQSTHMSGPTKEKYWRVCLAIATEKGNVDPTKVAGNQTESGKMMGQVLAITRCVPADSKGTVTEDQGSIQVFQAPHS